MEFADQRQRERFPNSATVEFLRDAGRVGRRVVAGSASSPMVELVQELNGSAA
jgi:hypothetical protein